MLPLLKIKRFGETGGLRADAQEYSSQDVHID